ncbi:serine-rich adhesin for platelets [Polistes fuscatus]|uniref:serine-rich adhesin for platelets n=1 Tax=Polistes fuscatus TaxID=30207 RepID=UPI001CA95E63|nr:serine-rich adhesin for platelets [Polistes fuscatus]
MATAGNASSAGGESNAADSNNVPQWKRDLILRRRQQNKVLLSSNGANVKLLSTEGGDVSVVVCRQEQRQDTSSTTTTRMKTVTTTTTTTSTTTTTTTTTREEEKSGSGINETGTIILADASSGVSSGGTGGGMGGLPIPTTIGPLVGREVASGATLFLSSNNCENDSVARNMRLEADLSLCSDSEDVNGSGSGATSGGSIKSTDMERKMEHGEDDYENDDNILGTRRTRDVGNNLIEEFRGNTTSTVRAATVGIKTNEAEAAAADAESDSSEELQYGPGIVNKLKSKYLNLALRETNKSRATVQRFRRAASLEDLLDREEDSTNEKNATIVVSDRKYAKRNVAGQTSGKTGGDRYRNASRSNETTMKRARSVETLVRYNVNSSSIDDSNLSKMSTNASRIASRQDPINDHIVLVDRSSVKIESRLSDIDRPKATNKPKRIKPVLAETERPPPDLVKTTMRIFEGSAKKLKPKGDVAAKVATFKTINDTFKAQNQKKVLPKPPLQPKPFANGNTRTNTTTTNSSSPKKIILPQKPTAELIEKDEEFHFDGVITDPIVQSVSSVVSKFQKIEKSHSPSPSPEPTFNKLRFSPAPSPEPQNRSKVCALEIGIKSPPVTPLLSPRISSPAAQSPSSPIKDANIPLLQSSSPIRKSSPIKENLETNKVIQTRTRQAEKEMVLSTRQRLPSPKKSVTIDSSIPKDPSIEELRLEPEIAEVESQEEAEAEVEIEEEEEEEKKEIEKGKDVEDGPKTISSSALDNISKAGTTMHFRFKDESNNREKNYLPGIKQNGSRKVEEKVTSVLKPNTCDIKTNESFAGTLRDQEIASRLFREKLAVDKDEKKKNDGNDEIIEEKKADNKPPKSASLISSTTTSYSQGNESKTIRCQKSESSPPQKQIGIIRPLVSTKTQLPQQNLSNRELEKNLINRVKSIEQPTKVVVSLKSADEIQPTKKSTPTVGTGIGTGTGTGGGGGGGGGGLWDAKPWNQQNNTMVFNFSNRKDVPDYIENDGLIIKRKREKSKVGDGSIIVLDATLDASTTDDSEWELSGGPPSPCDVSFLNDNVLINGRSNLSRTPRNHKHRIQFDDMATRTFEYPSEASMLEGESNIIDNESSTSGEQSTQITNKTSTAGSTTSIPSLLGGGGLASYTPSKVDLASEGFELGVTRATLTTGTGLTTNNANGNDQQQQGQNTSEVDYLKPAQDGNAWGSETTGDLLY